ncbi:MAG: hypothetical protein ACI8Z5_002289 [Lentimonas sp.]|jgi:hypothetical protein
MQLRHTHTSGMNFLLKLPFMVLFAATLWAASASAEDVSTGVEAEFQSVDLDQFIEQEIESSDRMEGRRVLKMADPVSFVAGMKRFPEERKLTYIYTALEVAGVQPLPDIGHRMFVESEEGRIIPVYLERQAALRLAAELKEGAEAEFFGYHVYSYSKGPALLVVDFVPIVEGGVDALQ